MEKQTILSSNFQFDLVCDRGSLPFVSTSVIFAGHFIGSIAVSTISDKFGRKIPLFVCGFFCCLFNFVSAFSPAFWVFAVFRSLVGFFIGEYQVLEWISTKWKAQKATWKNWIHFSQNDKTIFSPILYMTSFSFTIPPPPTPSPSSMLQTEHYNFLFYQIFVLNTTTPGHENNNTVLGGGSLINRLRGNSLLSLKRVQCLNLFSPIGVAMSICNVLVRNSPLVLYLSFLSFAFDIA